MGEANSNTFTFVVSDESVNKYGYRVLTSGIDLTEFKKNPVMFFNHHRSDEWTGNTDLLPVGRWENIRTDENNQLLMDAVLDLNDELGLKVFNKIKDNFLKAASIGIGVLEVSADEKLMLPGQTRETIKKSVLQEVSIVDIPANSNAMRLSFSGVSLTLNNSTDMAELNKKLPEIKTEELNDTSNGEEKLGANLSELLNSIIDTYAEANEVERATVIEEAGEAAGVSINDLLDASLNCPTMDNINSMAEFFGVSTEGIIAAAELDGCDFDAEEDREEVEEIEEELRLTFNSSISTFLESLQASYKLVKKEGVESGKLSGLINQLKADLSAFDKEKEEEHIGEIEELHSSLEILKAQLDITKEKANNNEVTIQKLKKANKNLVNKATDLKPEKEEAPITENKEELKEKTKFEKQVEAFGTLGKKYFKKKNS